MTAQLNLRLGLKRRREAVCRRLKRDPLFHDHAAVVIRTLADFYPEFTSDEVQEALRIQPTHPNSIGAAMHAAVCSGVVRRVGYRQSRRPEARARVVAVWSGVR